MRTTIITTAAALALVCPAAADYLGDIDAAAPGAAALMRRSAADWRAAPAIVKDRVGFFIFENDFPRKAEMSPDDMIGCIDRLAQKADPGRAVRSMILECSGEP
jgi:hypothetical protein